MRFTIKGIYYFIIYDIPQGVRNIIRWFPIIWGDRDWDSHFIFRLLQKKLSNVENHMRYYAWGLSSEKDADKIRVCVLLLDRIIKNNYEEMVFKHHDKKWGELEISYGKTDKTGYSTLDFNRINAKTIEEKEKEMGESIRLYEHRDMLLKQDVQYLFKLMNKHILGWWD